MAGYNGFPKVFGNALDHYRRVIFNNGDQAQRVREEILGDPSNRRDQTQAGPYRTHVSDELRGWPHKLYGQPGSVPAHTMLAVYNGNVQAPCHGPPEGAICVIVTHTTDLGTVTTSLWHLQSVWLLQEGMTFELLDRMDGNVPAVVNCGALRVNPSGVLHDAPESIHQLWERAQALFFETNKFETTERQCQYVLFLQNSQQWWWQAQRHWQQRIEQLQISGGHS